MAISVIALTTSSRGWNWTNSCQELKTLLSEGGREGGREGTEGEKGGGRRGREEGGREGLREGGREEVGEGGREGGRNEWGCCF